MKFQKRDGKKFGGELDAQFVDFNRRAQSKIHHPHSLLTSVRKRRDQSPDDPTLSR